MRTRKTRMYRPYWTDCVFRLAHSHSVPSLITRACLRYMRYFSYTYGMLVYAYTIEL